MTRNPPGPSKLLRWHPASIAASAAGALGLAALLLAVLLGTACGGGSDKSAPVKGNVFGNPGFEDGSDPWYSLKPPDFLVSDSVSHSGGHSAFLPFRAGLDETGNKIYYLVQEITPKEFPEAISGYYKVENWKKGTEKQYLQFVVIVFGAENRPPEFNNHQIRYILTGLDAPPFAIANAKFHFITKDLEPVQGQWVRFEQPVAEDFKRLWGDVPKNFDKIRLLFEVRYDDKQSGEGPVTADVYYDDLYFGPAPPP